MKVGTTNIILFDTIWKLSGPSSMIGSNLGNLEDEHFLGVMSRAGATSPQFWILLLISTFTIFLSIIN
jgi:hypothetical protein